MGSDDDDAPERPKRAPDPWLAFAVRLLLAGGLGAFAGTVTAWQIARSLPAIDNMPALKVVTRILDKNGNPIQSFGAERRFTVRFENVSPWFYKALIASEDKDFYQHRGVVPFAIAKRLFAHYLLRRSRAGGSTITQQLAKNLFLTNERTLNRKLKEAALAIRLEKTYGKNQILEMYGNLVNFGHARYGVEEASRFYYGKPARNLTVPEAALLAGIVQLPGRQSPLKDPKRSLKRLRYVLGRMAEDGAITPAQAAEYGKELPEINPRWASAGEAPYFNDEVRRQAVAAVGDEALQTGGLDVYTTLDPNLQRIAEKAVTYGLSLYEKRHGFRRDDLLNLDEDQVDPKSLDYPEWDEAPAIGEFYHAIVEKVSDSEATLRLGRNGKAPAAKLTLKNAAWTGCKKLSGCLKARDVVFVQVKGAAENDEALVVTLEQEPRTNAAFVAIDNGTGAVRALVGGFDYGVSKFNRAVQARRQTGSTMKALTYAGAIEAGIPPTHRLVDAPTSFLLDNAGCGGDDEYAPKNSNRRFTGLATMRGALEQSINVPSVELLRDSGFKVPIEVAKKAGITTKLRPYPSLALGAFDISLLEMTGAFTIFPTGGTRARPYFISRIADREGRAKYQSVAQTDKVISPQTAAVMTELLRGVVQRGTAAPAWVALQGGAIAGKTGTTDDYSNAWFIGYTPTLTAGAWVGFDNPKSLGRGEVGAVAALPIWTAFMRDARLDPAVKGGDFPQPPGLVKVLVDKRTGLRAAIDSRCREEDLFEETFIAGSEPQEYCSEKEHLRAALPAMLSGLAVDDELRLKISPRQLQRLLEKYAGFFTVDAERSRLVVNMDDKVFGVHHQDLRLALTDEPVAGADLMGEENWKCGQRTVLLDSRK